ncbi:CMP-N-acetylneuraminate-beta-galactosamide-alpha-2,3-sialyltransferase 1 isoform X5 [Molossus molossus]|uniref:CMP-N-acetylneuraminate-beta-galactosamide- alpha-2,3-sialyltransferase 1 isoform X5 n=1 Tax=Molossus molossus TaxID=27622 RepID=UPI001746E0A1|nr:CMP-N-acetylneuraminate-beta-galactosamide-alpha-2,3-sialyltransferase 1 isoform X5 [Molossus molossus]
MEVCPMSSCGLSHLGNSSGLSCGRGVLGGGDRTSAPLPQRGYQAGDRCVLGTQDILGPRSGRAWPCLQRRPWGVPLMLKSKLVPLPDSAFLTRTDLEIPTGVIGTAGDCGGRTLGALARTVPCEEQRWTVLQPPEEAESPDALTSPWKPGQLAGRRGQRCQGGVRPLRPEFVAERKQNRARGCRHAHSLAPRWPCLLWTLTSSAWKPVLVLSGAGIEAAFVRFAPSWSLTAGHDLAQSRQQQVCPEWMRGECLQHDDPLKGPKRDCQSLQRLTTLVHGVLHVPGM